MRVAPQHEVMPELLPGGGRSSVGRPSRGAIRCPASPSASGMTSKPASLLVRVAVDGYACCSPDHVGDRTEGC